MVMVLGGIIIEMVNNINERKDILVLLFLRMLGAAVKPWLMMLAHCDGW